jgi:hypothetical protein
MWKHRRTVGRCCVDALTFPFSNMPARHWHFCPEKKIYPVPGGPKRTYADRKRSDPTRSALRIPRSSGLAPEAPGLVPSDSIVKEPAHAAMQASRLGRARTNKRTAQFFWGILLPTDNQRQRFYTKFLVCQIIGNFLGGKGIVTTPKRG